MALPCEFESRHPHEVRRGKLTTSPFILEILDQEPVLVSEVILRLSRCEFHLPSDATVARTDIQATNCKQIFQ